MRYAIEQSVQWVAIFGGPVLLLTVVGVTLHIDRRLESYYIEVDPAVADKASIRAITRLASGLGFEVMPESECPPEEMTNGAVRHWMAEKEVVRDSSLEAV